VVLTLLALLEMCRKEEIVIIQEEVFGNIHVSSA
jgi:chromatin segregation and condensation protein Rec8/ScpA/Scc1 (kleisin family)